MAPISDIERQVFTNTYETYSGKLYGVCLHYVHDHAIAEDLLHDSFIVIFSSLGSLRDPARLEPWMCSIVRNIALKHLRQVQKMPSVRVFHSRSCVFTTEALFLQAAMRNQLLSRFFSNKTII